MWRGARVVLKEGYPLLAVTPTAREPRHSPLGHWPAFLILKSWGLRAWGWRVPDPPSAGHWCGRGRHELVQAACSCAVVRFAGDNPGATVPLSCKHPYPHLLGSQAKVVGHLRALDTHRGERDRPPDNLERLYLNLGLHRRGWGYAHQAPSIPAHAAASQGGLRELLGLGSPRGDPHFAKQAPKFIPEPPLRSPRLMTRPQFTVVPQERKHQFPAVGLDCRVVLALSWSGCSETRATDSSSLHKSLGRAASGRLWAQLCSWAEQGPLTPRHCPRSLPCVHTLPQVTLGLEAGLPEPSWTILCFQPSCNES